MEEELKEFSEKDLTYKPRKNYSYIIANAILESICYHNKINEPLAVSQFKDIEFYDWIDGNEDIFEILNKSTNIYKEATRIIRIFDLVKYKRPKYEVSTMKWFKDRDFSIEDNVVLKELMPLLLYYVGNCYEGSYTLFFEKLDFLIEYVIKPSLEHNNTFDKELLVVNSLRKDIDILDENQQIITVIAIQLKLRRVSTNRIEKILIYETYDDSTFRETSIDRVVLKQKETLSTTENTSIQNIKTKTIPNAVYKSYSVNNEVDTNIEVILECDCYVYEYFQMKPLKNMRVFDSNEIKMEEYYFDTEEDKFYIVANDKEEMILSTVLHCIPYAVILNNDDLNEKLIQRFKDYSKKARIDICPPPAPNEPNSSSSDETKKEEENNLPKNSKTQMSKEQQEKLNKEVKNINKDNNKIF